MVKKTVEVEVDLEVMEEETERGKAVLKGALRLLAAEPNEVLTVGNLKVTAGYRDGLFFLEGEKPRRFYDMGEILMKGFKR